MGKVNGVAKRPTRAPGAARLLELQLENAILKERVRGLEERITELKELLRAPSEAGTTGFAEVAARGLALAESQDDPDDEPEGGLRASDVSRRLDEVWGSGPVKPPETTQWAKGSTGSPWDFSEEEAPEAPPPDPEPQE